MHPLTSTFLIDSVDASIEYCPTRNWRGKAEQSSQHSLSMEAIGEAIWAEVISRLITPEGYVHSVDFLNNNKKRINIVYGFCFVCVIGFLYNWFKGIFNALKINFCKLRVAPFREGLGLAQQRAGGWKTVEMEAWGRSRWVWSRRKATQQTEGCRLVLSSKYSKYWSRRNLTNVFVLIV